MPIERAGEDRRMAKAHLKVHMGGIATAIEFYQTAPTPNLIILESRLRAAGAYGIASELAEYLRPDAPRSWSSATTTMSASIAS